MQPIQEPKPSLNLDPSLQTLLQDVDMALHSYTKTERKTPNELEVLSQEGGAETSSENFDQDTSVNLPRKSPAAQFGSQGVGSVVLPLELQDTIHRLISGAWSVQMV
jgi:hypothetical protein